MAEVDISDSNSMNNENLVLELKAINDLSPKLFSDIDYILSYQGKIIEDLKKIVLKYEKEDTSLKTLEKNLIEFKNQYNIAKKIQSSIFPSSLPNNQLISITAKLISLYETSGDFYDVTELISNSVYGVFIADIQGHGVSAALVTNLAKILFVNAAEKHISPSKVFDYINKEICNILRHRSFFTAFYIVVDFPNRQAMYSAGGHSYSLRYNIEKKDIEILDTKDTIIGLIPEISFEEKSFKFNIGDRIILYTDGIPEAKSENGNMFGNDRLYDLIRDNSELPAQELINLIETEVKQFTQSNHYNDDVTIIIIDINSDKSNAEEENTGKSYYSRDDISRLIEYYKKSIAIKEEQKDDDGLIKDLINLGSHLSKKGDSKEALEYIKKAEIISNKLNKIDILGQISELFGYTYINLGEYDKAITYTEKALDVFTKSDNNTKISDIYNLFFVIHSRKGDNEKARSYLYESLKINQLIEQNADVKTRIASLYNNIGFTYYIESNIDMALEYYLKSLEIVDQYDVAYLQGPLMNNIGDIYRQKGNYENALKYFHKCLTILSEIDNKELLIVILMNLSDIYFKIDDIQLSMYYNKKSIYVAEKYELLEFESFAKTIRAYKYIKNNNINDSINDVNNSLFINQKLTFDITQGFTKTIMGMLLSKKYEDSELQHKIDKLENLFFNKQSLPETYYEQAIEETSNPMNTDFHIPALYEYATYLYNKNIEIPSPEIFNKSIFYFKKALDISTEYGNYSEKKAAKKKIKELKINPNLFDNLE